MAIANYRDSVPTVSRVASRSTECWWDEIASIRKRFRITLILLRRGPELSFVDDESVR